MDPLALASEAEPTPVPAPAPRQPTPVSAAERPAYPPTASTPTQSGELGIRYDFNFGARVTLPDDAWHVRLRDLDSGNILFETDMSGGGFTSSKRFYIRFGIEVWRDGNVVFEHSYDARDRDVLVQFPIGTLGDILAWFPYAVKFQEKHGCRLTCAMSGLIIPLLKDAYPHIRLVTHDEMIEQKLAETFYATYSMGLFFDDADCVWQPTDFRHVGLHRTAGYILGVDPSDRKAEITLPDESRPIEEPYVCIAVQASSQSKYWNNPTGWHEVVAFLKKRGFRVICIDQKPVHGTGLVWNHIPHGAEDHTGDKPLAERARWLRHATALIGLSSGLAWLAWSAGCPVVMISGFTHPNNEFDTPFRVINWHSCNSCWNDVRHRFDHKDFLWCPRHANTPRQFECTRLITADAVIQTLLKIPDLALKQG